LSGYMNFWDFVPRLGLEGIVFFRS